MLLSLGRGSKPSWACESAKPIRAYALTRGSDARRAAASPITQAKAAAAAHTSSPPGFVSAGIGLRSCGRVGNIGPPVPLPGALVMPFGLRAFFAKAHSLDLCGLDAEDQQHAPHSLGATLTEGEVVAHPRARRCCSTVTANAGLLARYCPWRSINACHCGLMVSSSSSKYALALTTERIGLILVCRQRHY